MATTRQDLLREAESAARRGDLARAAEIYARILERTPNDLAIRQRLADALARTGREDEARDVFRRLAEDYWSGGYRARALAVLRRAIRLGEPEPELLALLGERTLEQGLVADAREPLLLAARAWESAGEIERAAEAWRRLADAFPRDVESRRALCRLADAAGESAARARARADLAEVLARTGDPEGAVAAFREALEADRECLAALDGLPSLLPPLVEAAPPPDAAVFGADDPGVAAGLLLLRVSLDHHAGRPAEREPVAALLDDDDLPPRAHLWAGRVLLDIGDVPGARRGILGGARRLLDRGDDVRDLLIGSLSGLLTRDPGAAEAMELLERLTAEPEEETPVDEPTGASAPAPRPAPAPPAGGGEGGDAPAAVTSGRQDAPDPAHLEARMIEARRLLAHGLADRARAVLEEVAAVALGHPGLAELRAEVERALQPASPVTPATPAPPGDVIALGDGSTPEDDDEGFEIVLDDFDGEGEAEEKTAPPAAASPGAPSATTTAPLPVVETARTGAAGSGGSGEQGEDAESGAVPGLDIGHLAREVRAAVSGEDAETTFQMGLGLVQMGLVDEAAELLGPVALSPERGWDAALVLVRAFAEAGRPAEAVSWGLRVLDAGLPHPREVERELLEVLVEASRAAGDQGQAEALTRRLAGLVEPA